MEIFISRRKESWEYNSLHKWRSVKKYAIPAKQKQQSDLQK